MRTTANEPVEEKEKMKIGAAERGKKERTMKSNQFWYSAKHAAHTNPHRCFVTIDGQEYEYTEWANENAEPLTKESFGDDLTLVAEADEGQYQIRVENPPSEQFKTWGR